MRKYYIKRKEGEWEGGWGMGGGNMATSELITSLRAFLKCVFGRGRGGGKK